jgi:hypothetical protein
MATKLTITFGSAKTGKVTMGIEAGLVRLGRSVNRCRRHGEEVEFGIQLPGMEKAAFFTTTKAKAVKVGSFEDWFSGADEDAADEDAAAEGTTA